MAALIARLAPWSLIALAVAGLVIWGLWGRIEAAETKLNAANAVIQQHEKDAKANAVSQRNVQITGNIVQGFAAPSYTAGSTNVVLGHKQT